MNKLHVIELEKEYVDKGTCILKYVCPSHTKDTVKVQGGEDWITVEFLETDIMAPNKFGYDTQAQVKSIECKFENGILIAKIQMKVPEQRKINVTFS